MSNFKNEDDFLKEIHLSNTIKGKYKFDSKREELMDSDISKITFENCEIHNGNFLSSIFNECTFNKVIFRESSLSGTIFKQCNFIKCRFSNIEPDFDIIDSRVELLSVTKESLETALRPWS